MPSHGSLTKAGKVRSATPKIPPKPKKNLIPKRRNRRNYIRRVLHATAESGIQAS
ncbi:MAG: 30S ribosomal protein S30e [Candidatus Methanomethylicota archaeon]|uniref:30S ribosomal protein S30e n=1 Tax=Thermoproteota archaeon TaxID=2056631 RepID=A0A497EN59_9CREN|nr:MAG: 30S ribosomal protein S30e [Candidatus Verstraetearchaeota archaeon]RLE52875.1 MAG: 30S ribosomal protein S30e [Candidatus Verstraetearchaeota archaeon]